MWNFMKWFWLILFIPSFALAGTEIKIESFLKEYCFECHDADIQKADFDIEKMFTEKPLVSNLKKWDQVVHLIEDGDMPPRDKKKQPSQVQKNEFMSTLKENLNSFDYSKVKNPGTEFARRLTNIEYENSVNDLFDTNLNLIQKLSPDLKSAESFSNNSRTLFFQAPVLEKFYSTAEYVVQKALPENPQTEQERKRTLKFFSLRDSQKRLYSFVRKAYRGKVYNSDFQKVMKVYQISRKSYTYEKSIRNSLEFILSSPRFLFKIEKPQGREEVGQYEMASRLSYFLWGTMPDQELLALAASGKLRDDTTIKNQVERMVASPKSIHLGKSLGAEWLKYEQVGVRNRPDPIDNKFMTDSLYEAMKKESSFFYTYLHKANKPIEELINAHYTFLNEELAHFYRIGGVKGNHIRPVKLKTSHRGGILTHASILMVTSHPDRSSPVLRGNWVLSDLLGTPPPPPPANIDELDEDEDVPLEDRLKEHSRKKQCAGCHSKIDPLGLSMNNFNKLGKWQKKKLKAETLSDGTKLQGIEDLKEYLTSKKLQTLKRNIVERTLSFALGRQLYYYDETSIRGILKVLSKPKTGFKDMLIAIAQSYPFKFNRLSQGN